MFLSFGMLIEIKKSTQLLKLLDELAGACMMELTSAALITPTDV
jgi:hypothetical protein